MDLLEAVYLRLRKTVVERVTVVKFRVDNKGSYGTGCFKIKVRTVRTCSYKLTKYLYNTTTH